ncbi:hypothetical protein A3Q35_13100 [Aeribacillus pallidus]|uniref:DUF3800 domain-containing protein n=1 Tax=Aeribacillus pallidus TaxID=33936 RepID=UPI0007B48833|nr:DUF3800 domain-containing protein [Aeribacillus pallidus]KZM54890.1 hypothetical protein A3Q35_13100 [Aeribacillus pallidus]
MKYYIFLDDSGQLHPNYPLGDHFVYGGLLLKESDFHGINYSYKNLVKTVKREKGIQGELKTANMDKQTKRRLLNKLRTFNCDQIFVTVKVSSLIRINFEKKKDVVRYKNYIIRRLIDKLIEIGKIPKNCDLIEIHIDNQNIAHSAKDSLEEHLINFFNEDNYYYIHKQYNTTSFKSDFRVFYKDSESNYLVQAADLLANTMFNALEHNHNLYKMFKKGYICLNLPESMY